MHLWVHRVYNPNGMASFVDRSLTGYFSALLDYNAETIAGLSFHQLRQLLEIASESIYQFQQQDPSL